MPKPDYLPETSYDWVSLDNDEVGIINAALYKTDPRFSRIAMDLLGFSGPDEERYLMFKMLWFSNQRLVLSGDLPLFDEETTTNGVTEVVKTYGISAYLISCSMLERDGFQSGIVLLRSAQFSPLEYEKGRNRLIEETNNHLRELNRRDIPTPVPIYLRDFIADLRLG